MKLNIRFVFTVVSALIAAAAIYEISSAQNKKPASTIVDFYNMYSPGALKFKNNKWYAEAITEGEIEIDADIKNGYLTWSDPGTGGGTLTTEAALFVTSDKRRILAVNKIDFDGVGISSEVRFYEYANDRIKEIKSGILPELKTEIFMQDNYDKNLYSAFESCLSSIRLKYNLPRVGTSITVTPEISTAAFCIMTGDLNHTEKVKAEKFLQNIFPSNIELNWNMKKGIFTIGKKIKRKF